MITVKVNAILEAQISTEEAFRALCVKLGVEKFIFNDLRNSYYMIEDGNLVYMEDTSYHGSPSWEKRIICNDSKVIQAYILMKELQELFITIDESEHD